MAEQNTTTLRDALRNVAGISIAAGEGGAQGDNLTIRGFSARNDLYIDGMRDFGSYYRDPFNLEEVDVVQGPSAATFGRGSTGGVVNQATKMPTLLRPSPAPSMAVPMEPAAPPPTSICLSPALGKGASFRMNVMGTEGGVAGRDVAHQPPLRRGSLALLRDRNSDSCDAQLSESAGRRHTRLWDSLALQPARSGRHATTTTASARGTICAPKTTSRPCARSTISRSHISIRNQTRYARYLRDVQITEPQILGTVTPATPLSAISINRNQLVSNSVEAFLANQTDVTMNFQTGAVKHTAVAGVELDREDSDPTRPRYTGVPTTSLLVPDDTQSVRRGSHHQYHCPRPFEQRLRICDRYREARLALGIERLLPVRPLQLALYAGGSASHGLQPAGSPAFLARRRCLQAHHAGQHLCVGRQFLQPFGRIPVAQREHCEPSAGRESHLRSGREMGPCAPRPIAAHCPLPEPTN